GRGRGKSRGGLGKYLRARGRGRGGGGRPAEFHKRLVLEDEEVLELDPESEEAKELAREQARKYARRQLGSNADQYAEQEPALNSDGEVDREPEVDISTFMARQRLDDLNESSNPLVLGHDDDSDDIDASLAHLVPKSSAAPRNLKGKVQTIEWDEELEEIRREKEVADANRDLKMRFRANAEKEKSRQARSTSSIQSKAHPKGKEMLAEAPPLPTETLTPLKGEKGEMEDFLDDLL
ncbi:hypothetical protein DFH11DRAFT_1469446, partial [Phellopilus nigrolimitatus]